MDDYEQIAVKIIAGQETIIGPVAIEQATQLSNLKVNWDDHKVSISGDKAAAIDRLINRYKQLFGQISVEVSKEAAAPLIPHLPAGKLPKALS
jgi:hypothetical protein